ncbi:unnamed protein product [Closterium sp. Naga37s-1]|nr:unnamed protein product [Closterium sp. Naga37s-1]
MRGIAVGSVVAVRPSLTSVDVVVEILDEDIVIPRGTPIFVNQSGLIAETLIDMTPLLPIPEYDAGPRDAGCREEGVIVCHRERVDGEIGVSMDEMVRLYVKMGRDAEREKAKREGESAMGVCWDESEGDKGTGGGDSENSEVSVRMRRSEARGHECRVLGKGSEQLRERLKRDD